MSNTRRLFRQQVRQARKDNMVPGVSNRQIRRAIAFRPGSDEGRRAWTTYLSQQSSSQHSDTPSEG